MKEKILIVEDQFVEADYLRGMLTQAGYTVTGIARSVLQAQEMIRTETPDFVLVDIFLKGKETGIDLAKQLAEDNIAFVYLSANSNEELLNDAKATNPYGFLVKPFRERDLLVTLEIARYRHTHSLESNYKKAAELRKLFRHIGQQQLPVEQRLLKIGMALQSHIPYDLMEVGVADPGPAGFAGICFLRIGLTEDQVIGMKELSTITRRPLQELMALPSGLPKERLLCDSFHLLSLLTIPLNRADAPGFHISLYSRRADAYLPEHMALVDLLEESLCNSIRDLLANAASAGVSMAGAAGPVPKPGPSECFGNIIGKSHLLLNVFDHISQVAASDTSVLLLGESGTGKERIADCIHQLSTRKNEPFIKVNCAALPSTLIESELFGHERGAFTGADEKRIGKFEKANKGTILLDEIGEMPPELQVKLLRVLQEKEIEPVGAKDPVRINVRIIAATNRNLEKEVAEGRFRLDLYYRLNVFPITLPPLRDRKEDIPALAYYFMNYYNRKSGKRISGISEPVLKKMMGYSWPGNVRELEHLIERSVLLTKSAVIEEVFLPLVSRESSPAQDVLRVKTIHENERDYIISVLKRCNGKIWGAGAAAEMLNIPPSTLKSKMKKLGIRKEYTENRESY